MDRLTAGRLNDAVGLSVSVTRMDGTVPPMEADGDPARGETLKVKWSKFWNEGAQLTLEFKKCYVDRIEFIWRGKPGLTGATLYSGDRALSVYRAETGKLITENPISLRADLVADRLTLRLDTWFEGIEVSDVSLWGASLPDSPIFPVPNDISVGDRRFVYRGVTSCEGAEKALKVLKRKYLRECGIELKEGAAGVRFVKEPGHKNNGWRLRVAEDGAELGFSDERGAVMAAEAFISLCGPDGVRECEAALEPKLPFRGVHLYLPAKKSMDFAYRFFDEFISPLGYNRAIIEVAGGLQFRSHPEINDAVTNAVKRHAEGKGPLFPHGSVAEGEPLDHESAASFADHVRELGIDVIPEIQSLGHVQFMTTAHPGIAELAPEEETERTDDRQEDQRPEKLFPHCYCPSREESYKLLFDLADEIIEVFRPAEYVHMGHDEVYDIGICPLCAGKDPAKLFADDVNRIYDYVRGKGLKMAIWSDMLQPVTKYRTPPAIDLIPKDILMMDFIWYFHMDKDIEDNLLEKGYSVVIGNLYSSHFPRYLSRAYKPGMLGGEISAWVPTKLDNLDREGKLYDFMMTAQMLLSDYDPRLGCFYDRQISRLTPAVREKLTGEVYPSLHKETRLIKDFCPDPSASVPAPFESMDLDIEAESLIFTQALTSPVTRRAWEACPDVGAWRITLSDGEVIERKLLSGRNVGYLRRRAHDPITHGIFRHNGYTTSFMCDVENLTDPSGEPLSLYRDEVILPRGAEVKKIELIPGDRDGKVRLYKLEAVK